MNLLLFLFFNGLLKVLPVVQDTKLSIPHHSEQDSLKYSIKKKQLPSRPTFIVLLNVLLRGAKGQCSQGTAFYCLETFSGAPWNRDRPVSRAAPTQPTK